MNVGPPLKFLERIQSFQTRTLGQTKDTYDDDLSQP